jgi:hypothetical protein
MPDPKKQSSRAAAEEAIRKSKERCPRCAKPLPWTGPCPCPDERELQVDSMDEFRDMLGE